MKGYKDLLRRAQSGQVIVLMAFGMIALLAVLGLAIDGGRLYFLRADVHNASDAAVLASTYALCTGEADVRQPGFAAAAENGVVHNGDNVIVEISSPPATMSVDTSDGGSPNEYVEVHVYERINPYFIQLVFGDALSVDMHGLGRCEVGWDPYVDGRALISTHEGCSCEGVSVTGSSNYIEGGVASGSSIKSQGSSHQIDGVVEMACGPFTVGNVGNNLTISPNNEVYELQNSTLPPDNLFNIADYAPGGVYAQQAGSLYWEIPGGGQINLNKNAEENRFKQGGLIYASGDLKIIGGMDVPVTMTIVATGDIHIAGNLMQMSPYSGGLLMFSNVGSGNCDKNTGIRVTGSAAIWNGIVYAPNGHVRMPGSSNFAAHGGVIADSIALPGSTNEIHYDASLFDTGDPVITIIQ